MKKREEEHVNMERWLVSYADFITLLFAFFVVMYSISQADINKLRKVSESIRQAFGISGPTGMIEFQGSSGGATFNQFEEIEIPGGRVLNMPAGRTHTAAEPDAEVQGLKEMLEETISMELGVSELSERASMIFDSQGLVLRMAVKDVFEPNKIEVTSDLKPLLDRIGRVLTRTKRQVRIEGHADDNEKDPWELSTNRATWIVKYWVSKFQFNPAQLGAAGYGSFRPLSKSASEWGQGGNRRFEIVVTNNRYEEDAE